MGLDRPNQNLAICQRLTLQTAVLKGCNQPMKTQSTSPAHVPRSYSCFAC